MARGRKKKVIDPIVLIGSNGDINFDPSAENDLSRLGEWDVKLNDKIEFFDSNLSYEITGYRPIDGTRGLNFDPGWFTEAKKSKESTGKYCHFIPKSKQYNDFWLEQYKRCRDGYTVNGYTITGDNYFFLNYYRLMNLSDTEKAGGGRDIAFPSFFVKQYEYFHYIELCKRLRLNAVGLKSRGVGFSEIGANITINSYSVRQRSKTLIVANIEKYVNDFLSKCWEQLNFLDSETDGGFRKLRQKINKSDEKKASSVDVYGVESGFMSHIRGTVADKPNKIRGDRVDYLIYEEAGSWPNFTKAFIQGEPLVSSQGQRFGIKMAWGTGRYKD